ncbi:MAG: methyltransferase [Oscillospiraceae bacterium]|nr:methyltransferase [Oscillospiraceae bacterium]
MSIILKEDETIEDLQLEGLKLIQKQDSFRFGMDSVILAHFAEIRENDIVADFGTGNGVLVLLLRGRKKGKSYYALDIQQEAAELTERNIRLNHLEDITTVIHTDAVYASKYIPSCSVDKIICNPPYGQPYSTLASPSKQKAIARNQDEETLDHFFTGAFSVLKGRGKIYIVYPAPQMLYIMKLLQKHHLEPKRFQLVYPYIHKPANLVLIEAVKDARPTLHPMKPLVIYEKEGDLTNELKSVYHLQEQTGF